MWQPVLVQLFSIIGLMSDANMGDGVTQLVAGTDAVFFDVEHENANTVPNAKPAIIMSDSFFILK